MVFSSFTFLAFFLPAVTILYFLGKSPAWRNGVLLVFSLLFYAWGEPRFVLMMVLSILVNYLAALGIEHSRSDAGRRGWMLLGVSLSLGFLAWFKYAAFLVDAVRGLFSLGPGSLKQVLPIGISFYTFQILTYTVDVYRGKVPAQHSLPRLALYISFFPQLIAGPIVNYSYIEPQLAEREHSWEDFSAGLERFVIGLAKKVLLANRCGELLGGIDTAGQMSVLGAWITALAFSLQIYFDFSGYSDMAIGMGRMFGFRFQENFDRPYTSLSVTEFWRRWHISLGSFFREYVYIPLGGNRVSPARHILNLMIVWGLTGFWHGASWNFLLWGLYYGVLLVLEKRLLGGRLAEGRGFIGWLRTLLLVVLGWVIFYHEDVGEGLRHIGALFGVGVSGLTDGVARYYAKAYLGVLILCCLACVPWGRLLNRKQTVPRRGGAHAAAPRAAEERSAPTILRLTAVSLLFVLCLVFLTGSSFNPFLYFRF